MADAGPLRPDPGPGPSPDDPHPAASTTTATTTPRSLADPSSCTPRDPDADADADSVSVSISAAAAAAPPSASAATDKKQRACDPCRGLKVKCEWPADDHPVGSAAANPCRRCTKSGRQCIVSVRARTNERHKRTDTRVSELEKRIDELTASLQAKGSAAAPPPTKSAAHAAATAAAAAIAGYRAEEQERSAAATAAASAASAASVPAVAAVAAAADAEHLAPSSPDASPHQKPPRPPKRRRDDGAVPGHHAPADVDPEPEPPRMPGPPPGEAYKQLVEHDVIDRGVVSAARAEELFAHYRERMMPHMPGVVFPPSMRASDLRRAKPVLFLALMAAAASESQAMQRQLVRESMFVLSELAIVDGKKSLELVQALHMTVIWYWPPEHSEELKFYQLVNLAMSIAIDIGLGARPRGQMRKMAGYAWRGGRVAGLGPTASAASAPVAAETSTQDGDGASGKNNNNGGNSTSAANFISGGPRRATENSESIVARRTWLTCYYLSSNAAISLRRPTLLRWSGFLAESVRILETSPEAAPTDRTLCTLVRMNQLGEEIGLQFSPNDGWMRSGLGDVRTQVSLRAFEGALETLRRETPRECMIPAVCIGFEMTSMYLHEVILQSDELDTDPAVADDHSKCYLPPNGPEDSMPKQPLIQGSPRYLTTSHISCIGALLGAVTALFDAFLAMDVASVRSLPVYNFVRVAYAVVLLVKIYFSASVAGSDVARAIPKESIRLEFYIDRLVEKFRATVQGNKSRPAAKFLVVLIMLKRWAASEDARSDAAERPQEKRLPQMPKQQPRPSFQQQQQQQQQQQHQQQQHQQQPDFQSHLARTPLHVLSAVATENHPSTSGPPAPQPAQQQQQQQPHQQQQQQQQQFSPAWPQTQTNSPPQNQGYMPFTSLGPPYPPMVHHGLAGAGCFAGAGAGTGTGAATSQSATSPLVAAAMAAGPPALFLPSHQSAWNGGVDLVMPDASAAAAAAAAAASASASASVHGAFDGMVGPEAAHMNMNIDFEGLMVNFGIGLPAVYADAYKPLFADGGLMDLDEAVVGVHPM